MIVTDRVFRICEGTGVLAAVALSAAWGLLTSWSGRSTRPGTPSTRVVNSLGMEFVLVPAGTFNMGSPDDEPTRESDEGPRHKVIISRPTLMGRCEVTQAEYLAVMGENPSHFHAGHGGGPDHPVENVSWREAAEFCRRLSALPAEAAAGLRYRLPTEAEWEHACRAGTDTAFSVGGELSLRDAAFNGIRLCGDSPDGRYPNAGTLPVARRPANPHGLHDMHGNVWEWCWDSPRDYADGPRATDPSGPADVLRRTLRGGAWEDCARLCRSARRNNAPPTFRHKYVGFRVVCEPVGPMHRAGPGSDMPADGCEGGGPR